jgi:hypothetical protein
MLLDLYNRNDIHVLSTWETFVYMKDLEDFLDTLSVLQDIKLGKISPSPTSSLSAFR